MPEERQLQNRMDYQKLYMLARLYQMTWHKLAQSNEQQRAGLVTEIQTPHLLIEVRFDLEV